MASPKRRRKPRPGVSDKESTPPRSREGFFTPAKPQSTIEVIVIDDIETPVTWKKKRRPSPAVNQENCQPRIRDIVQDEPPALAMGSKRTNSAQMGTRTLDGDSKQRRRSARLLNRDMDNKDCRASDSDDNNPQEDSSASSQGRKRSRRANKVEEDAFFSPNPPMPAPKNEKKKRKNKKKMKKKKKKRFTGKAGDLGSDSEKENVQREIEENGHLGFGELGRNRGRKSHISRCMPLLGRSICQGWTKAQDIALHNAYFTVKPVPNFWKEIAKLVPGKSSNECFHRFYSAHPTPPVSQPRSRLNGNKSGSPVRSLDDMHALLKPAGSSRRKSSSAKQNLLHARKTVRHILRKQMSDDQGYEADLFSVVETLDSSLQSHMLPAINAPETPNSGIRCGGISTLSACHTKSLSRFSAESHRQVQQQLVSPEVLKRVKNPALHDKYIDQLHSREAARKKIWTQNAKVHSNCVQANMEKVPQTDMVYAAKAAVIAEAQQVLRQSQRNEKGNYLGIGYFVRNSDEELNDEDAEEQEEEIEYENLI